MSELLHPTLEVVEGVEYLGIELPIKGYFELVRDADDGTLISFYHNISKLVEIVEREMSSLAREYFEQGFAVYWRVDKDEFEMSNCNFRRFSLKNINVELKDKLESIIKETFYLSDEDKKNKGYNIQRSYAIPSKAEDISFYKSGRFDYQH